MKKYLLITIMAFVIFATKAQTITGKVTDEQNQPIEFANVSLYSLPDSALITGTVTNQAGEFSLSENGNAKKSMFLKISFLGYETQTVSAIAEQTIVLRNDTKMLGKVVVQGHRKVFQMQSGNIVANVSGTVLEKEVNALEVLRKIPGMTLKGGQLLSFIGGTPIVYINGKKAQSMAEVQQLEVKNIKTVELNTNPGAEYDASTGAVLLIITHKRIEGLAVQVENTVRRNHFWSHENTVKVNYNQNKINIFGQIGYSDWRRKTAQDITTIVYAPDTIWKSIVNLCNSYRSSSAFSYSFGAEYSISDNYNVGLKYDGTADKYKSKINQPLSLWANDKLVSHLDGNSAMNNKSNSHYINGYFSGKMNDKLQLSVFADYLTKHRNDNQSVNEKSAEYGENQTNINTVSNNNLFAVTPKLVYSLNEKHRLSIGGEYSVSNVHTSLKYQPQNHTDTQSENVENRVTGYVSYSFNNSGFGLDAGFRYEMVKSRYDDLNNADNNIHRTYGDWFPNIQVSYQKGLWSQSLSYRSGISRPSFSSLNGNTFYVNQFMYQEGNPKLVPEISHNVQYNFMYRFVYLSLKYGYFKNTIQNDFQTPSPASNIVKSTWANYDKTEQLQALLNLRHTFGFYTPSLTLAYMQNFMTVPTNNGMEHIKKPFEYINFNNDFDLLNGFLFNAEYSYTGRGTAGFLYFEPTHIFNARVQKTFLDKKLQVSISANDIFGKNIGRFGGQVNHIYMHSVDNQDRRSIVLNLIWRFNNYKITYKGQAASESEINRL